MTGCAAPHLQRKSRPPNPTTNYEKGKKKPQGSLLRIAQYSDTFSALSSRAKRGIRSSAGGKTADSSRQNRALGMTILFLTVACLPPRRDYNVQSSISSLFLVPRAKAHTAPPENGTASNLLERAGNGARKESAPRFSTPYLVPVPLSATVCGLAPPSSYTPSVAVLAPPCLGVNVTLMVQFPPAGTLVPQLLV